MDLKTTTLRDVLAVSLWTSTSPHFVDIEETGGIGAIGNAIEMPWPQLNPRSSRNTMPTPKRGTVRREILQNYHRFLASALIISSPKKWITFLMIPVATALQLGNEAVNTRSS